LIHVAREQFSEAKAEFEQALQEERLLVGPDDPEAIDSLYQLGVLRQTAGDPDGAAVPLGEALDRCVRVFGENHEKTARVLLALAEEKKGGEARERIERALAIRRRVLPPGHPDLAEALGALAQWYWLENNLPRARELYTEALATFR